VGTSVGPETDHDSTAPAGPTTAVTKPAQPACKRRDRAALRGGLEGVRDWCKRWTDVSHCLIAFSDSMLDVIEAGIDPALPDCNLALEAAD
jgi:hypothetical protein